MLEATKFHLWKIFQVKTLYKIFLILMGVEKKKK